MISISGGEGFPLPQVAKSLSPYIRTRQEVLQIRRILSLYISSNIEGLPAGALSPTSLAVPGEDAQVKKIPSEVSGLRRGYLKALQAHAKARKEYNQLTHDSLPDTDSVRRNERQEQEDSKESVATYLALTREQLKFEKLRILQDYLDMLSQKDAARPDYLQMQSILKNVVPPPEGIQVPALRTMPSSTSEADSQVLTTRLEKAVLCTKNAFDNQKRLLAKVKQDKQIQRVPGQTAAYSTVIRIDALNYTRDELITWIEERLAKSSQFSHANDKLPTTENMSAPLKIEKRKREIQDKYEDYLEARKSLVGLMLSREPLPMQNTNHNADDVEPQAQDRIVASALHEASSVLPYLTEYLIPAANAQKSFLQQESHVSSTLASETKATVQVLDRLAEESHLLPNYPILAMQPRFQNVVAALKSKSLPSTLGEARGKENESQRLSQARQWAFAADAARSAKQEAVKERLDHGNTHIHTAEGLVVELQEILGVDEEDIEEGKDEGDIWTESIETKLQEQTSSGRQTGIWAGLDGRIGVETDKARKGP